MLMALMTWPELDLRLAGGVCAMLPVGSIEQHGPMGLIGTDTICASEIAKKAADLNGAIVAPEIAYTPAPFNTAFPGTVSITPELLRSLVAQICRGLLDQGFCGVFIVNGHGANLDPISKATTDLPEGAIRVQSWWAPPAVDTLRKSLYGDWEGMHATPSEISITQAVYGAKDAGSAALPPKKLSAEYIRSRNGDRHGPPDKHRAAFPDGRVGSHSALAKPEHGARLLDVAAKAIADEFNVFSSEQKQRAS